MTTQKKKDLKDQYQVTDLKEYDVYMYNCMSIKEGNNGGTMEQKNT